MVVTSNHFIFHPFLICRYVVADSFCSRDLQLVLPAVDDVSTIHLLTSDPVADYNNQGV